MAVVFAARAALRVLPLLQWETSAGRTSEFPQQILLGGFRATAVAWTAAKYPTHLQELASAARASGAFAVIGGASRLPAAARVYRAAVCASDAAFAAASGHSAASACASGADMAAHAFAPAVFLADGYSVPAITAITASDAARAAHTGRTFWSAVSLDATHVEEGAVASVIAGSPLWPQGQPDWLQSLWQELEAWLLAAKQDWQVWTIWYNDRLDGRVRGEERELAYMRLDEALWGQGPAAVNAEIKRLIAELEPPSNVVAELAQSEAGDHFNAEGTAVSSSLSVIGVAEPVVAIEAIPPEPSPELGPILRVTERGLELISQPSGDDLDEGLQKALHYRLRRLLPVLKAATHKVANAHPALDHVVSEYSDLLASPFDELDVGSLWAMGTGLLAFRAAFANQASGTMTEPLEPGHLALLQQAAEIHGAFILGFPKGRELTDRADRTRLSPEVIAQIDAPSHRILDELRKARQFVEERTRKFLSAIDEICIVHGWEAARTGYAAYVVTRNSLIALARAAIRVNSQLGTVVGGVLLNSADPDLQMTKHIIQFMLENTRVLTSFAEPFPELRNWLAYVFDHIDQEKKD